MRAPSARNTASGGYQVETVQLRQKVATQSTSRCVLRASVNKIEQGTGLSGLQGGFSNVWHSLCLTTLVVKKRVNAASVELRSAIVLVSAIALTLLAPGPGSWRHDAANSSSVFSLSEPDYSGPLLSTPRVIQGLNSSMSGLAQFAGYDAFQTRVDLHGTGQIVSITRYVGQLLPMLRMELLAEDQSLRSSPHIFISEEFWERSFSRSENILGQTITLLNQEYRISGIVRRSSEPLSSTEVWVPISSRTRDGRMASLRIIGKLSPGSILTATERKLASVVRAELRKAHLAGVRGIHMLPFERTLDFAETPIFTASLAADYLSSGI